MNSLLPYVFSVVGNLASEDALAASEPPWYLRPVKFFGYFEFPVIVLIIIVALLLAGGVYLVYSGYRKEIQRQKELEAKRAKQKSGKKKK